MFDRYGASELRLEKHEVSKQIEPEVSLLPPIDLNLKARAGFAHKEKTDQMIASNEADDDPIVKLNKFFNESSKKRSPRKAPRHNHYIV